MTVVGATTIDEYYKHFEKDHAMNRRFSIVTLKENTKEETLEILKGIKGYYESYHQIKIDNVLLKVFKYYNSSSNGLPKIRKTIK